MKQTTRVLAILLALLMALSCTAIAAEALTVAATYNGADLEGATVPAGGEITLTFSNNVTDASVLANNVSKIKVKNAEGTEVSASVSAGDKQVLLVTLGSDLAKGAYTLTLGKDLKAKNDLTLGTKVEYNFNVKGSGSGTGGGDKKLEVASVTVNDAPLEGATIKAGDTIVVTFTNGMTEHGADSAKLIRILKDDGTAVACEVTYPKDKSDDVAKKQFTVVVGEIEAGSYKLVLGADIMANNGNTLGQDVEFAFSVEADETEPLTLWARIKLFFTDLITKINVFFMPLYSKILILLIKMRIISFPYGIEPAVN